jgi:putative ABC transport system ATP-binding protein
MNEVIRTEKISKYYQTGSLEVKAVDKVNLTVQEGEFIAIIGASGSGKSTFLNLIGCLDVPTEGEYYLDGELVNGLSKNKLADIRNQKIGFVFQGYNLLARTTALDNVALPLVYDRVRKIKNPLDLAKEALKKVGLEDRMHHDPSELSGGEQQRVAVARALVNDPAIILADEPTGNLDSKTTVEIIQLLKSLNQQGVTIMLITHEPDVAAYAQRVVEFKDGLIIRDEQMDQVKSI